PPDHRIAPGSQRAPPLADKAIIPRGDGRRRSINRAHTGRPAGHAPRIHNWQSGQSNLLLLSCYTKALGKQIVGHTASEQLNMKLHTLNIRPEVLAIIVSVLAFFVAPVFVYSNNVTHMPGLTLGVV